MAVSIVPLLLLALQTPPIARSNSPNPPAIVAVPSFPPPPVIVALPGQSPQDEARLRGTPHRIEVRLSAGRETIWQGSMLVSMRQGAQVTYSKSEASQPLCPEDLNAYELVQSGVSINVRPTGERTLANRYALDIRWMRPAEQRGCGTSGTRAVDVDQIVVLPLGETVTVNGDGGLLIQVTRRD